MLFGLFENYTSTSSPSSKKKKFPAIVIKRQSSVVYRTILEELNKDNFYAIEENKEYGDLLAKKNGFELSFQVSQNGLESIVEMSVFGENKRGRTRRFFKQYYYKFVALLK